MDDAQKLSAKWDKSGLLAEIKDPNDRNTMAMLLENQAKQLVTEANVTGGTTSMNGGGYNSENWAGVALPLVRRVFGEIAAKEFVSVQPMNLPSGLVFYLDFKYGTGVNPFRTGDSLYSANPSNNTTDFANTSSLYGAGRFGYSINPFTSSVANSTVTTPTWLTFNFDGNYSASFSSYKVINVPLPTGYDTLGFRSFVISSGSAFAATDVLQAFTSVTNNTASFVVTGSKVSQPSGSIGVTLYYNVQPTPDQRGDFEDGGTLSQANPIAIATIDVKLKSEPIVAKTRRLKAQWTPEFSQDLNAYHSVDAEAELTGILSQYISMEIDLEILDMLIVNAFTVDYWNASNNVAMDGTGITNANLGFYNTQGGWFQTLGTKLQKVSNKIHQLTLRGGANFLVTSPTVSTILESIPGFASDGDGEKDQFNFGIQKIGSLNSRYKVYKNPYMTENVIFLGYKGSQFLECGAVFAPYVPLIMTPLLYDPNTFTPRKGLMTRYAKKMIRPDYYGKIYVSGLNTI
ncbi:unnamed protein product [Wuchereria bancrofti]|uniref:Major capsid protein n=1 Tax=Wuchereria bancrofti TaxID=6293 RepID=A0A3P7DMS9_WUCBA|nr:unnamed protein product [Wuchereria bancrofti]